VKVMSPTNGTSVWKSTVGSSFEARWKLWIAERSWTTIVYVPGREARHLPAARVVQRDVEAVIRADDRVEHGVVLAARRARREGEDSERGDEGNDQLSSAHLQAGCRRATLESTS
jgi:hypothetical protein